MKGFGNKDRSTKKPIKKQVSALDINKMISNALSLHLDGKIEEASKIYNFLINNKYYDPRVLNNLGSIYFQRKHFDKAISLFDESEYLALSQLSTNFKILSIDSLAIPSEIICFEIDSLFSLLVSIENRTCRKL